MFFKMTVCCVFSLESTRLGDSDEYTQYTIFNIQKKITLNYLKSAATGLFPRTQRRVRNSRGKRAISVRATEVLLYISKRATLIKRDDVDSVLIQRYVSGIMRISRLGRSTST